MATRKNTATLDSIRDGARAESNVARLLYRMGQDMRESLPEGIPLELHADLDALIGEARHLEQRLGALTEAADTLSVSHPAVGASLDLHDELIIEAGAVRLVLHTLSEHHDAPIGSPVTAEQSRDIGICVAQLGLAIGRLERLAGEVDDAEQAVTVPDDKEGER